MSELRGEMPTNPPKERPVTNPHPEINPVSPKIPTQEIFPSPLVENDSRPIDTHNEPRLETARPAEEGPEQRELHPESNLPKKNNRVPGKSTPLNYLFNKLYYPSYTDARIVQEKLSVPTTITTIASTLATAFGFSEPYRNFAVANPDLALNILLSNLAVTLVSGVAMAGSFRLGDRLKKTEEKNRIPLSQLLTVSKVFTTGQSLITPVVTKVEPSFKAGFTGELHFIGENKASWEGLTSPLATLRDGAKGLFNLATACEQQDPRLEGISIFYGISPIINSQFEKFGFRIFHKRDLGKQSLVSKLFDIIALAREGPSTTYPNGVTVDNKLFNIGTISREALIRHKGTYAKFAKS